MTGKWIQHRALENILRAGRKNGEMCGEFKIYREVRDINEITRSTFQREHRPPSMKYSL